MTLKANEAPSGGKRAEPIEPGSYPARLVQVIDLGLQPQVYLGETKEPRVEIFTTYELSDEFMKDEEGNDIEDKPRWQSETFTLNSLNSDRAKSTERYYALDPEAKYDGDWSKLLGSPANVTIIVNEGKGKNKGKVFNNIGSVSAMRPKDAAKLPPLVNEPKFFTLDAPDVEVFLSLPNFIQKRIKEGLEYEGSKLHKLLENYKGNPSKKAHKEPDDYISNEEKYQDGEPEQDDGGNW